MRLAAALLLTTMVAACGGQSAPAPESTDVRTIGSVGDGPADGGGSSDAGDGGDARD